MSTLKRQKYLDLQKKYYLGKILCAIDPSHPDAFLKYHFHHVFIVFGFTGSGKDTIINEFLKRSATQKPPKPRFIKFFRTMTRSRRPKELDFSDGFFIEKELFDELKRRSRFFYAYKRYSGKEFGYDTLHFIFELTRGHVIMIGGHEKNRDDLVKGIQSLFFNIPITTIFVNRPKAHIIKSLKKRGGKPEDTERRIEYIQKNWYKNPKQPMDYYIWNTNLKKSVQRFTVIASIAERAQRAKQSPRACNRVISQK